MMKGGEVGGVIAASATAEIAMRLVKENSPRQMVDRVLAHIRKQGYFIVDKDPDTATLAAHPRIAKVTTRGGSGERCMADRSRGPGSAVHHRRAAIALRANGWCASARSAAACPPGRSSTTFHVPTLGVSLANYDDNQHTDNENLRLGNLWNGIVTLAAIMTAK